MQKFRYQTIRNGLVGYWRPSRGPSGTTLFDSVRGNHGTFGNNTTWTTSGGGGNGGYALSFAATNHVEVPTVGGLELYAGTVSCWLRTSAPGSTFRGLVVKENAYSLFLLDQQLIAYSWSGNVTWNTGVNLADNLWHHVALSFNTGVANGSYIAIDGLVRLTFNYNILAHNDILAFAGNPPSSQGYTGLLDDIAILNRPLTSGETLTLYQSGRGGLDQRIDVPIFRGAAVGGTTVTPGTATLTLTAFAPTVTATANETYTPSTASLTLTTFAPTVTTPQTVTPSTASLTLTAFDPTVTATANQVATPDTAALTLTTFAPTADLSNANTVTPGTASLSLTTFAPTVTATANLVATPDTATLALSAFAPTVSTASASVTVTPDTAALTITTYAPSLSSVGQSWTIRFVGSESCSGGLTATVTTGGLTISTLEHV